MSPSCNAVADRGLSPWTVSRIAWPRACPSAPTVSVGVRAVISAEHIYGCAFTQSSTPWYLGELAALSLVFCLRPQQLPLCV